MDHLTPERAQDLLAQLKATMGNEEIWPEPKFDEVSDVEASKAAYRDEALVAWNALYLFTCQAWDNTCNEWTDTPELSGIELCTDHWMFVSCPRRSFIEAIQFVASQDQNKDAAGFLFLMLGVMATSWRDWLHNLHRSEPDRSTNNKREDDYV